jgi:hypothetical protein
VNMGWKKFLMPDRKKSLLAAIIFSVMPFEVFELYICKSEICLALYGYQKVYYFFGLQVVKDVLTGVPAHFSPVYTAAALALAYLASCVVLHFVGPVRMKKARGK